MFHYNRLDATRTRQFKLPHMTKCSLHLFDGESFVQSVVFNFRPVHTVGFRDRSVAWNFF